MPVSVRLPALTAAMHQCTVSTTSPGGAGSFQVRISGSTAVGFRTPNSVGNQRVAVALWVATANPPTGGAVIEFCMADGSDHVAALTFLRDAETYARANPLATDAMGQAEIIRGMRVIADYVRTNGLKAP